MKTLRVAAWTSLGLFAVWGFIALFHRLTHEPEQSRFFFWYVFPYPVLIRLTVLIISASARHNRLGGAGFNWFAVAIGAAASIGLAFAVSAGLSSIMSWAYFGYVSLGFAAPTDPKLVAISIAVSAACSIWAGAISATLSPQRPLLHSFAAGTALLLWFCALTLMMQPLVVSQLLIAVALPVPLSALGGWLQQNRITNSHG